MRELRIRLLRHAEVHNPTGVVYGALPGFALSDRGRGQARAAAEFLAGVVEGRVTLTASPLDRAQETARLVASRLAHRDGAPPEVSIDARLTEAGTAFDGLPRRFAPLAYMRRLLDPVARARRESAGVVLDRMASAVRAALEPAELGDVILVSHQFPIWMARVAFDGPTLAPGAEAAVRVAPWLLMRDGCAPASVTTLAFEGERLTGVTYWEPHA